MGLVQTAAPSGEPLSLADAKNFLRLDADLVHDDVLVTALVKAARRQAEKATGRQLLTATWQLTLEGFYDRAYTDWHETLGQIIRLPKPPLRELLSLTYVDWGGDTQTLDPDDLVVDTASEPGRVGLTYGLFWPSARPQLGGVTLTFRAGYGAAADVPEDVVTGMLLCLDDWYHGRTGAKGAIGDVPPAADGLWNSCWHGAIA